MAPSDPTTQDHHSLPSIGSTLFYAMSLASSSLVFPFFMLAALSAHGEANQIYDAIVLSQLAYISSVGATVSKAGLDGWYLGRAAADPSCSVHYVAILLRTVLPIAVLVSAVLFVIGTPTELLAWGILSAILEGISAIRSAELSGRSMLARVAVASWLNLPFFVAMILLVPLASTIQPTFISQQSLLGLLLVFANLVRACILFGGGPPITGDRPPRLRRRASLGVHQILNYAMFRADALLATFILVPTAPLVPFLLYSARYQEIAGGGAALGTLLLVPRMAAARRKEIVLALAVWVTGCVVVGGVILSLFSGEERSLVTAGLAILNTSLALYVTLETQRLLIAQRIKHLVAVSALAVAAGGGVALLVLALNVPQFAPLAVAVPLVFFSVACRVSNRSTQSS